MTIFDVDKSGVSYQIVKVIPAMMPLPEGVRAAFPLEGYAGRIAAVVSPDIFESLDGYVTVFHEFVHCYQYSTCETELKKTLDLTQLAKETGDVMWEINYPFPYTAKRFINGYQGFMDAVAARDETEIQRTRVELHTYLGVHDFEYMVWQEWKEGLARWVENRIQRELGLPENTGGSQQPFNRVVFYAGGAAFIDFLSAHNPGLLQDLPNLYKNIYGKKE